MARLNGSLLLGVKECVCHQLCSCATRCGVHHTRYRNSVGMLNGPGLTAPTVTVNDRVNELVPPPLSASVTVIVACPLALATGVKLSVAVLLPAMWLIVGLGTIPGWLE